MTRTLILLASLLVVGMVSAESPDWAEFNKAIGYAPPVEEEKDKPEQRVNQFGVPYKKSTYDTGAVDRMLAEGYTPPEQEEHLESNRLQSHNYSRQINIFWILVACLGVAFCLYFFKDLNRKRLKPTPKSVVQRGLFSLPTKKTIRLAIIGIIAVTLLNIVLYQFLIDNGVEPSDRLGWLDRIALASPFCGLIWLVGATFRRAETRGYYFRYRYAQTLSLILYFAALQVGFDNLIYTPLQGSGRTLSYGSELGTFFFALTFWFIIWSLIASIFALPVIIWKSRRLQFSTTVVEAESPQQSYSEIDESTEASSISDRLRVLKTLLNDDLISREDYERKKAELLEQV
jgi:hypothetical protein